MQGENKNLHELHLSKQVTIFNAMREQKFTWDPPFYASDDSMQGEGFWIGACAGGGEGVGGILKKLLPMFDSLQTQVKPSLHIPSSLFLECQSVGF